MVGVILKCRFIVPGSKKFRAYIDYISRTEAVRSEHFSKYSAYVGEYMDDRDKQNFVSEKVSALFTRTKNNLTQKEKEALQKQFETAQKNLSPMWQNVISFDNRFLQEHGIYDQSTNFFDEEKLQSVTRQAMEKMLQSENMGSSAIWSASVHFNTDNLHIHIAVAEPYPTRPLKNFTIRDREGQKKIVTQYKAALKPGTLDKMKSQVVNAIVDRSEHLKKINDLIRDNLVGTVKNDELYANRKFKKQYQAIYRQLPKDKRLWQYNMSALAPLRPALDELVTSYIYHCHSEDFKALNTTLDEQQAFLKSAYGEGEKNLYEKYKKTKLSDLYIRMGNTVLQDMKKFSAISDQKKYARKFEKLRTHQRTNSTRGLSPINELRKALKKDFESIRNTNTYEQLMSEVHAGHLGEDMER